MSRNRFGEKLKKAVRERGLSQTQAAKIFGITQQQMSNWMSGKSAPSLEDFEKILKVFGKEANYFFDNLQLSPGNTCKEVDIIRKYLDISQELQAILSEISKNLEKKGKKKEYK